MLDVVVVGVNENVTDGDLVGVSDPVNDSDGDAV